MIICFIEAAKCFLAFGEDFQKKVLLHEKAIFNITLLVTLVCSCPAGFFSKYGGA
jgi:hypothetical protein